MAWETIFGGRLQRQTLPLMTPAAGVSMPDLKRLSLAQGELAQFHDGGEGVHYLAALELKPGAIRGNHYHVVKVERVYVVSGGMELVARDLDSDETVTWALRAGDLALIQPRVAHAFRVTAAGVAIEFAPTPFDPQDIHPLSLI